MLISRHDDYKTFIIREKLVNGESLTADDMLYLSNLQLRLQCMSRDDVAACHSIYSEVIGSYITILILRGIVKGRDII